MDDSIRRYQNIIHFFTRDERIKTENITKKVNEVVVEIKNPIEFPDYMANNINFFA